MSSRPTKKRAIWLTSLVLGLAASACIGQRSVSASSDSPEGLAGPDLVLTDPGTTPLRPDPRPSVPATARVSLERRYQTLEGFGAAIAWYQDRIVGETPAGLYEALFPELGLDILRLRNRYERSESDDRNLSLDAEVVRRATKALGHLPRVFLTSWSPPSALKASARERCRGEKDCTLKKEGGEFVYDQFADYWAESLTQYASLGIVPEFVSIQNEPNFTPSDWEGCRFEPTESAEYPGYDEALRVVHRRLSARPGGAPKFLGPETMGIHDNTVQRYLKHLDPTLLYGVAHHLYEKGGDEIWDWRSPGPDSYADEMRGLAESSHKPLFQTEFMTDEDNGKEGGFETALLIHHSLVEEGAVAFVYWDLVWDGSSGLIGMHGRVPRLRDQYFSMRHFARFTDPGHVRVATITDSPGLLASAWIDPTEKQLTMIVLNRGEQPLDVRLQADGFAPATAACHRTTFRPGASQRWAVLPSCPSPGSFLLPTRSIATVVWIR